MATQQKGHEKDTAEREGSSGSQREGSSGSQREGSSGSQREGSSGSQRAGSSGGRRERSSGGQSERGQAIDLNSASAEEIAAQVEGIGPTRAQKIVEYREKNGPFSSTQDLMNIEGFDQQLVSVVERSVKLKRAA